VEASDVNITVTSSKTTLSKNDTALACYDFDEHQTVFDIFSRNVAEKVSSQMVLYFPTLLT